MLGSVSRTDEMFILLNRLANNPDEEAQQSLLPDSLTQRKSSFTQPAKPGGQSILWGSTADNPPRTSNDGFLQVTPLPFSNRVHLLGAGWGVAQVW